ncbi:MAG: hypothetical protein NUW02_00855 [Candidatus Campbellbacteria bacterium]|nr:hypothetical protein [Candidatus Campbellbacteria bacterium]
MLGHLFKEVWYGEREEGWLIYLVLDLQTLRVLEISDDHVHLELVPGCFWPEMVLPNGTRVSCNTKGARVGTGIIEGNEIREDICCGKTYTWVNYHVRDVATGRLVLVAEAWIEPLPE